MDMDYTDQLVTDEPTTAHRSGDTGGSVRYIVFSTRRSDGREEAHSIPVRLPAEARDIELHGPEHFRRSGGRVEYGVMVRFLQPAGEKSSEPGRLLRRGRFIPLAQPAFRLELLDRVPDERWLRVA
jgi:hypothetical protein